MALAATMNFGNRRTSLFSAALCYAILYSFERISDEVFIFEGSVLRGSERYISCCNPFTDYPYAAINLINELIISGSVAYASISII